MNDRDTELLGQMLEYCHKIDDRIIEFTIDETAFIESSAFEDMLLMPVFQIGELAHGLSEGFCETHQQIPWHAIKAFRNIIAHDYGVVDPLWSWNTIQSDIPVLERFLQSVLNG